MFAPAAPFVPATGATGPHAQTLLAWALKPFTSGDVTRERWTTPDGDFLDVDLLVAPKDRPHVVILHGLEGSSRAGYVRALLRGIASRGWGGVAMNFRSCSGEPNIRLKSYSSGETEDPLWLTAELRRRGVTGPLFGVGFSLGGNVLLKLLGDAGRTAPFSAAVAVSTPFDLAACAHALDEGGGLTRIYRGVFLRTLKKKALAKALQFPGSLADDLIVAARGIVAFDDAVTAPLYGFPTAEAYYRGCSSGPKLPDIAVPTLLVNAEDDPLVPASSLPSPSWAHPFVRVLRTKKGGHVGFVAGSLMRPHYWAEAEALAFLDQALEGRKAA